jgi:hypothetical protein
MPADGMSSPEENLHYRPVGCNALGGYPNVETRCSVKIYQKIVTWNCLLTVLLKT